MEYRKEIDGLRAVAVLPVILFHSGLSEFSGGFVGVDVFFVISGYLITTIILSEMERGTFSVVRFYERRARRILPALFLVMLVSVPFAWLWLLPKDAIDFSQSLAAVSLFASNFLFWIESGYWDTASELKPMLHTWSLAVEEQYYVVFPLFLMLLWRWRKRHILGSFLVIAALSLAFAEWSSHEKPVFAFYMLPTRGWELAIGATIAFYFLYPQKPLTRLMGHPLLCELMGCIGLLAIAYSVVTFDEDTAFPGIYALLPTLGTGLIIIFSSAETIVGRILSTKLMTSVGLISYSAYLWHQPLLAFLRQRSLTEPSELTCVVIGLLSLPCAYLSWRYVEKPFRQKERISKRSILIFAVTGSALFIVLGYVGQLDNGWKSRGDISYASFEEEPICERKSFRPDSVCELSASKNSITFLIGDSHSGALARPMQKEFSAKHVGLLHISKSGCIPIQNVYRYDREKQSPMGEKSCYRFNEKLYKYIQEHSEIEYVAIAARWALNMEGSRFDNREGGIEKSKQKPHLDLIQNGEVQFHPNYNHQTEIASAYVASIQKLLDMGKKVILIYPIPEAGWFVPRYLYKYQFIYPTKGITPDTGSTSYAVFKKRNQRSYQALDNLGNQPNLFRVYPEKIFCNSVVKDRCVVHENGVPYYKDDDHLSNAGAILVAETVTKIITSGVKN